MVTIRGDLTEDLSRFFYDSIQGPLDEFCAGYACAGIRDNPSAAQKARGNHYGEYYVNDKGYTVPIPARQFIWAALREIEDGDMRFTADEVKDILVKTINQNPRVQKQEWSSRGNGNLYRETTQRALSPLKGGNFDGVFKKLADKMQQRLVNAVMSVNIIGPDQNAPSTIAKKGFDHPLVETGEMVESIEGWTHEEDKD